VIRLQKKEHLHPEPNTKRRGIANVILSCPTILSMTTEQNLWQLKHWVMKDVCNSHVSVSSIR
jgi:hypothetical protein